MNVYVESNFVLELALEQEESSDCEQILTWSESNQISLRIPAYALLEPWETITRRTKGWAELGQRVTSDLKQFERSAPLAEEARAFQNLMVRATHHATSRFQTYRERLLKSARVLVIDAETLGFSNDFRDKLQLPDAVMLASVLRDLDGSDAVFVNRNRKDFDDPDIRSELESKRCSVKWTFRASVAHLTSALTPKA